MKFFPNGLIGIISIALYCLCLPTLSIATEKSKEDKDLNDPEKKPKDSQQRVLNLSPVKVLGTPLYGALYTRETIQNTPSGNQDISSLLIDNPAVRFNSSAGSSLNRGSMSVDEISIHGSSPYQNLFTIDGFGATNNIDPAEKNGNLKPSTIPSNSQAYFLDTSLLDSVAVYDRNIPIEYGNFTGGVVDARLKRAGPRNTFRMSYWWNTSNLTKQKVAEGDERNWDLGSPGFSPKWKKGFYSLSSELRLTEKLGLTISASKRKSDISRFHVVEFEGRNQREQSQFSDQVDNILAKLSYAYAPESFIDLTLKYSDRKESLVSHTLRDTAWDNQHNAKGIGLAINHNFDSGSKLELKLGWDYMGSFQNSVANSLITHMKPGLQSYTTGGYGKNEKSKDLFTIGSRYHFAPQQFGDITNTTYLGFDYEYTDFRFERHQDSYSMIQRWNANGGVKESNKVLNQKGIIKENYSTTAAYISNNTQWRSLSLNLGARIDYDDLFNNTNLSPRANIEWDISEDGDSLLSFGRSRYYGSDILNLALRERIESLRFQVLNSKGQPVPIAKAKLAVDYNGLKTPYDDEWALGFQQKLGNFLGEISLVRRYGRNQVTKKVTGNNEFYENNGQSKNDSVSLAIRLIEPLKLGPSYWTSNLQFNWQRTKRNTDYAIGYDSLAIDNSIDVFYNGTQMRHIDMPTTSFYQPRQLSFHLNTDIPNHGIKWTNIWRWRSNKQDIVYVGMKEGLQSYQSARLGSYWIWDTKLIWKPPVARGAEFSIEVLNVLNKMPSLVAGNPNLRLDRTQYKTGRELRLQVSYQY